MVAQAFMSLLWPIPLRIPFRRAGSAPLNQTQLKGKGWGKQPSRIRKGEITMNTGDTAFVLMSAALVMLMTPGLALCGEPLPEFALSP